MLCARVCCVVTDSADGAREAYEALAPHYDFFTATHDYDAWTAVLEALMRDHGVSRGRLLDVACGTGKSFLPLHRRGWQISGCDLSPAMLREAAHKVPGVALEVCDMRQLPRLGSFDAVWCVDDALNYLLDQRELADALAGMRRNLREGGVLLFDVNTLATYRGFFASTVVAAAADRVVIWQGDCAPDSGPGVRTEATVTAFSVRPDGSWDRVQAVHRQQHHLDSAVQDALTEAGFEPLGLYGQGLDGRPVAGVDELRHTKAVYVARATYRVRRGREVSRSDQPRASGSPRGNGGVDPEGQLTPSRGVA